MTFLPNKRWGQWVGATTDASAAEVVMEIDQQTPQFGALHFTPTDVKQATALAYPKHALVELSTSGDDVRAQGHAFSWTHPNGPSEPISMRGTIRGNVLEAEIEIAAKIPLIATWDEEPAPLDARTLTWASFKAEIDGIGYASHDPGEAVFIYRGQGIGHTLLRTSIHRLGTRSLLGYIRQAGRLAYYLEPLLQRRFDISDTEDLLTLLYLAQHHGFPTPFLDWTESPFVAAYFAFYNTPKATAATSSDTVRIFAFEKGPWVSDRRQRPADLRHNNQAFTVVQPRVSANDRALPQQSVVTFSSLVNIEAHLRRASMGRSSPYIQVIDLPVSERSRVMADLQQMGITHASLFPGIEGTCRAIAERYF